MLLFTGCVFSVYRCSPYVSWKEEVQLNDGRVITVEQRKLMQGGIDREAWLTINLPEFSVKPIVWHEHLRPMNLNIDNGMLYVVGMPPTNREIQLYGCPDNEVVGYRWKGGQWLRIPFNQIPQSIYTTNMLIDQYPPDGSSFITLQAKNSKSLNGNYGLSHYWRLDPNHGKNCQAHSSPL